MDVRKEFETWAKAYGLDMTRFPFGPHLYHDDVTEMMWQGFENGYRIAQEATQEAPQAPVTPVGEASYMPGTEGFTMACFKASDVPGGTKLYKGHPPGYVNHEKIAEFLRSLGYIRNMSASALAEAIADYINDNESVYD